MFFIAGGISQIMSKGQVVSRPSIHIFGVRSVVSCSIERYAIMTNCNCSSPLVWFSLTKWGWSGGAKVLGKLPVPGRPTILITVGQGPTALAVGAGGGCLDIFTLIYIFSSLSPSLWETARYRLKYCLKGPLNPKQPTNQPTLTKALSIAVSVLLKRSTIPSDFGCYGVVLVFVICSNLHISENDLLSNCLP